MMRFSRWIASRVVSEIDDIEDPQVRARVGLLEGWASVGLNVGLFIVKMALGLMAGSVSVVADAVHTLSDSLTSLIVIFGFRMSAKPPDEKHPFGHGRIESIAAVVVSVLLGVVAFEMLIVSIKRIVSPRAMEASLWVILALVGTMIVKAVLARFSEDLGEMIDSDMLHADAWHHKSDVFSTLLVLIALIGGRWQITWLDGAMGIGVAAFIGWAAVMTMRRAVGPLVGVKAPQKMYREIMRLARAHPQVEGVHDILVHRYGSTNIISVHIEVSHTISPMELHEIGEEIEEKISRRYAGHAIVHVDPLNYEHEHYETVQGIVEDAIRKNESIASFHDLRLMGSDERLKVVFDVVPAHHAGEAEIDVFRLSFENSMQESFPGAHVSINVEPTYLR